MNKVLNIILLGLVIVLTSCKPTNKEKIESILNEVFDEINLTDEIRILLISETDCIECVEESIGVINSDNNNYLGLTYGGKSFPYKDQLIKASKIINWQELEDIQLFNYIQMEYGFGHGPFIFKFINGELENVSAVNYF